MLRREFITLLGGATIARPLIARAQEPAVPSIGFLHSASREQTAKRLDAFLKGLGDAGFRDGRNVTIEYRWAGETPTSCRPWRPISSAGMWRSPASIVAKSATTTIPIVFGTGGDPVAMGLVASLSRPDGNVTGVTSLNADIASKRLALIHQLVPQATHCFAPINRRRRCPTPSSGMCWTAVQGSAFRSISFAPAANRKSMRSSRACRKGPTAC